jgi:hypothetical protein
MEYTAPPIAVPPLDIPEPYSISLSTVFSDKRTDDISSVELSR